MLSLTASRMAAGISLPLTSQFRKALRRSASTSLPTSRAVTVLTTLHSSSARRQALQSTSLQALPSVRAARVAAVAPTLLLQATRSSPTTSTRPRLPRLSAQERVGRISTSSTAGKTRPARASRVYPMDIRAFQQGPTARPTAVTPTIADQVPTTSSSAPTVYS